MGCTARIRMGWSGMGRALLLAAIAMPVAGAELKVLVDDGKLPLADAVVSLEPISASATVIPGKGIMDQRNSQFVPGVLLITAGSMVTFPNSDNIRHQVYSFSPAKSFNLSLYAGTPAAPVRFDRPGVVAIGCNIHDWMIGYIVVLDTPYFAKTNAQGVASVKAPVGKYSMTVWHSRLAADAYKVDAVLLDGANDGKSVHLKLALPAPARRGDRRLKPKPGTGYR